MNILIINHHYFSQELRSLGHRVEVIGFGPESFSDPYQFCEIEKLYEKLPQDFEPELVIYIDDSRPLKVYGIERLNVPTIFYSIDAHIHINWHIYLGAVCDHVFVAQKDYLSRFLQLNSSASWLPLWAPAATDYLCDRQIEVSFRGNIDPGIHPKRPAFFQKLSELVKVDYGFGPYKDVYSNSKIVVNELINNDLNFRVFEAMACGAMLLTPITSNGLLDIFVPNVDFIPYEIDDAEDAAKKIEYYLKNDNKRLKIAQNGQKKVEQHTSTHRAKEIENIAISLNSNKNPEKYLGAAMLQMFLYNQLSLYSPDLGNQLLIRTSRTLSDYCDFGGANLQRVRAMLVVFSELIKKSEDISTLIACVEYIKNIHKYFASDVIITALVVRVVLLSGLNDDIESMSQRHGATVDQMIQIAESLRSPMC